MQLDNWTEILSSVLSKYEKEGIKGIGGIYGFDGYKYTAYGYFHISEPIAKAIADLFIKYEEYDNNDNDNYEPPSTVSDLKDALSIENENFLIISLNSKLLYATNDKHCILAYRCQFSFVLLLFSNFFGIEPKSLLYEKLETQTSSELQKDQQAKAINPEKLSKIIFEIANEIMKQGG